ncbi:unnamed protein product [Bathycoccus prasinos]
MDSVKLNSPCRCGERAPRREDPMHLYCTFTLEKSLNCSSLFEQGSKTLYMRQFDWGGRLPKSNGGVRR